PRPRALLRDPSRSLLIEVAACPTGDLASPGASRTAVVPCCAVVVRRSQRRVTIGRRWRGAMVRADGPLEPNDLVSSVEGKNPGTAGSRNGGPRPTRGSRAPPRQPLRHHGSDPRSTGRWN